MKHSRRQIQEAISYWQKQLKKIDESSSFRNRNNIDTVSELYQLAKETSTYRMKKDTDEYENRVWQGEWKSVLEDLKDIEKNLRLLGSKNGDIEEERKVYASLGPVYKSIIESLIYIIRSRYGMSLQGYGVKVLNKHIDRVHTASDEEMNAEQPDSKDNLLKARRKRR